MVQELKGEERDFILLNVFVLAQQGYVDRAATLMEALAVLGDHSSDVLFGRAVLKFFRREWSGALACLDELDLVDPIERFGYYEITLVQRMRRYLKARCLFELGGHSQAREAVDVYLRHGLRSTSREELE